MNNKDPEQQPRWQSVDTSAYDKQWADLEAAGKSAHGEVDFVQRFSPTSVLDAGCGTGRVAIELAARGYDVVGVDLDEPFIETAQRKAPDLDFRRGDLSTLDLGRTFDVAVMAGNIMIFVSPGTEPDVIERLTVHLNPGGRLISGFQLNRGLSAEHYVELCEAAGLETEQHNSTWSGDAPSPNDDYAVFVHRLPE